MVSSFRLLDKYVDLHIHTMYSDGEYTPDELVKKSSSLGFQAISVTDHDTVESIPKVLKNAGGSLEIIPGVELSVENKFSHLSHGGKEEIHIVGLLINHNEPTLLKTLTELSFRRKERMCGMIERLNRMGMEISMEDVKQFVRGGIISRLHLAQAMKKKGYVKNVWEAFDRFIGDGKPAYVGGGRLSFKEAISLIKKAGGVSILAHPHLLKDKGLIPSLVKEGLEGIEVYHPDYGENPSEVLMAVAKRYNLLISGGSDCHGLAKEKIFLGKVRVPYQVLEQLKKRLLRYENSHP